MSLLPVTRASCVISLSPRLHTWENGTAMLTGGQPPGLTRREWHASSQHGVGCTVQIQQCRDVSLRTAKLLACSISRSSFWSASAHHSDKQRRGWVLEDVPQVCTMCICSETSSWTKWRPTGAAPRSLLIPWRREVKGCTSQTLHPLETAGSGLAVPFSELCYWMNECFRAASTAIGR